MLIYVVGNSNTKELFKSHCNLQQYG